MLEEITSFRAVAEHKSLAKAARSLGISAPMMTRRIQKLETELGARLFNRTTRTVQLTEAGQLFYEKAQEIWLHFESGRKSMSSLHDNIAGTLKIGLPASLSALWVTPMLAEFFTQYPDVRLQLVTGNHLLDMLNDGFDIVIHCGSLPDSSFYSRKLRDWYKLTCAAPSYFAKHTKPSHPHELSAHNCLDHYDNLSSGWRYDVSGKTELFHVQGDLKANSSIDLKNAAVAGLGVVYLPDFVVEKALAEDALVTVLDDFSPKPLGMYAVYPSKEYLPLKTKVMLDFLVDLFKPD